MVAEGSIMNVRNAKKLSLASLAASLTAAGLIGVSGVAAGDEPLFCNTGTFCLVYDPTEGHLVGQCGVIEGECMCIHQSWWGISWGYDSPCEG